MDLKLPNERSITLGPEDPIPSPLLNELQDQIVASSRKSRPARAFPMGGASPEAWIVGAGGGGSLPRLLCIQVGSPALAMLDQVEDGGTLTEVVVPLHGDGSADIVITVWHTTDGIANATSIGARTVNNSPFGPTDYIVTGLTPTTVSGNGYIFVTLDPSATGIGVGPVRYKHER